jgi:hypothetical protein
MELNNLLSCSQEPALEPDMNLISLSLIYALVLPSHLNPVLESGDRFSFRLKFRMHFSFLLFMLNATVHLILFDLIS